MRWKVPKPTPETSYNSADVVRGLTDYYQLLSQAGYLAPGEVKTPPAGGWTDADLAIEALRALNFAEEVIDLYRQIPYVPRYEIQIWPETRCLSWLRDEDDSHAEWVNDYKQHGRTWEPHPTENLPSHMASLSVGIGSLGTAWLVDTKTGFITGIGPNPEIHSYPEDQLWKAYRSYPIPYFFEKAKADILSLRCVPVPAGRLAPGHEIWEGQSRHSLERMRGIYRRNGWPDLANFNKGRCLVGLEVAQEDEADWETE